jgi:hypothetical protein
MSDIERVPAYIPCHAKDLGTLPYCIEGLRKHPQVGAIHVVAAAELKADCDRLGVGFVDELSLVDPWFPADSPYGDLRWFYAMALKLSVAFIPDAPPRYLILDADTVFLRPFPLFDEKTSVVLHPRMKERRQPYYTGVGQLLGHEITYVGSYISHYMLFSSAYVRAMFEEFARVRGRPAEVEEGREVLREFLTGADRNRVSFADYESYGYYIRDHDPDEMHLVERDQVNVLCVSPREWVLKLLRRDYDYCNFHAYRHPTNPLLAAVGLCWLATRIVRNRIRGLFGLGPPPP